MHWFRPSLLNSLSPHANTLPVWVSRKVPSQPQWTDTMFKVFGTSTYVEEIYPKKIKIPTPTTQKLAHGKHMGLEQWFSQSGHWQYPMQLFWMKVQKYHKVYSILKLWSQYRNSRHSRPCVQTPVSQHRNQKCGAQASWPAGVYKHQTQLAEQGWVCAVWLWYCVITDIWLPGTSLLVSNPQWVRLHQLPPALYFKKVLLSTHL